MTRSASSIAFIERPFLNLLASSVTSTTPPILLLAGSVAAAVIGALLLRIGKKKKYEDISEQIASLLLQEETKDSGSECIYLDYNGTTPVHPLVLAAMLPFLTVHFGNPSSSHAYGIVPQRAIQNARRNLLKLLMHSAEREPLTSLWFTGCGTESDNLAIQLALDEGASSVAAEKKHIVTTNVEHPAITKCLEHLKKTRNDIEVTYIPVQPDGRVAAEDVRKAIQPNTILVTVMLANNESGALMPIRDIGRICQEHKVLFHTDAAQACGKVDLRTLLCEEDDDGGDGKLLPDLVTLVGHKMGAPKGIAALYVRPGLHPQRTSLLLHGGGQEFGTRGGTENVPYMVGMGRAAELSLENLEKNVEHMQQLRSRLSERLEELLNGITTVRPNGPVDPEHRLPNTLSVGIQNVQSGDLLQNLQDRVAASAGAACHSSDAGSISSVLRAMKVPNDFAAGTLRLTVGPSTTTQDVEKAARIIAAEVKRQLLQNSQN